MRFRRRSCFVIGGLTGPGWVNLIPWSYLNSRSHGESGRALPRLPSCDTFAHGQPSPAVILWTVDANEIRDSLSEYQAILLEYIELKARSEEHTSELQSH